MKNKMLWLLIFIGQIMFGQEIMIGNVDKIVDGSSFIFEMDTNMYTVLLKDSEVLKKEESIEYLQSKILHKKVVLVENTLESEDTILTNGIMYDCVWYETEKDEIPCRSANVVNVEMFQYGLLKYTGNNEFLKNISK